MKKFIKTAAMLTAAILATILFCACWDLRELDTIAIVTGMGLDISENPGEINLSLQIGLAANASTTKKGASGEESSFVLIEDSGKGIASALYKLRTKNSRAPFLHHAQILIIGKEQAQAGIKQHMDVLLREHEMRVEMLCAVSDCTAKNVLSKEIEPEKQSALAFTRLIHSGENFSKSFVVKLLQFVSLTEKDGDATYMPIICIKKQDEKDNVEYKGFAIFKDGKMIGEIDFETVNGFLWTQKLKRRKLEIVEENGYCDLSIFQVMVDTDFTINPQGLPEIEIAIKGLMDISEIQGFDGLQLSDIVGIIEDRAAQTAQQELYRCYEYLQLIKADIYRFGDLIYRRNPRYWRTIEQDWDDIFAQLELKCQIELKLKDTGKIYESLMMKERS